MKKNKIKIKHSLVKIIFLIFLILSVSASSVAGGYFFNKNILNKSEKNKTDVNNLNFDFTKSFIRMETTAETISNIDNKFESFFDEQVNKNIKYGTDFFLKKLNKNYVNNIGGSVELELVSQPNSIFIKGSKDMNIYIKEWNETASNVWEPGTLKNITYSFVNDSVILIADEINGIWTSTDGGTNFSQVSGISAGASNPIRVLKVLSFKGSLIVEVEQSWFDRSPTPNPKYIDVYYSKPNNFSSLSKISNVSTWQWDDHEWSQTSASIGSTTGNKIIGMTTVSFASLNNTVAIFTKAGEFYIDNIDSTNPPTVKALKIARPGGSGNIYNLSNMETEGFICTPNGLISSIQSNPTNKNLLFSYGEKTTTLLCTVDLSKRIFQETLSANTLSQGALTYMNHEYWLLDEERGLFSWTKSKIENRDDIKFAGWSKDSVVKPDYSTSPIYNKRGIDIHKMGSKEIVTFRDVSTPSPITNFIINSQYEDPEDPSITRTDLVQIPALDGLIIHKIVSIKGEYWILTSGGIFVTYPKEEYSPSDFSKSFTFEGSDSEEILDAYNLGTDSTEPGLPDKVYIVTKSKGIFIITEK